MRTYNERSGVEFRVHFTDSYDAPTIPETAHWRLDCEETGTVLQDWTVATVTTESDETGIVDVYATIEIPSSLNAIQRSNSTKELKTLLVVANKDQSSEFSETLQYYVKNLRGRS